MIIKGNIIIIIITITSSLTAIFQKELG